MTTIAFKDGIVAADTGVMTRSMRAGYTVKIVQRHGSVAGGTGDAAWTATFREWFMRGVKSKYPLIPLVNGDPVGKGVVFWRDGRIEIFEQHGRFTLITDQFAIGSGTSEARGAMLAGATAEEAVRIAMQLDDSTFGDVTVLHVGA